MPQRKTIKWDYDSVRDYHAIYRDSVLVDMHYDAETGWENVWAHKDSTYTINTYSEFDDLSHESQYYIVPSFFAIITTLAIFAFVLLRDNEQALKQKRKDSVLNMMSKK